MATAEKPSYDNEFWASPRALELAHERLFGGQKVHVCGVCGIDNSFYVQITRSKTGVLMKAYCTECHKLYKMMSLHR
jgi:hypothetical protein